MRKLATVLALAGVLAACSDDHTVPAGPPPPGCDRASWGTCSSGPSWTEASCTAAYGTWLPTGCTLTDAVGRCVDMSTGDTTYYYYPYTTYTASQDCTGLFTPMGARESAWCDAISTYGFCVDVSGTESDMAASGSMWMSICSAYGGTWETIGACPTSGRAGTCSFADAGVDADERFYDAAIAPYAASQCTSDGGSWTYN